MFLRFAGRSFSQASRPFSSKLKSSGYESVIGLEVHVQLLTKSKLFSGAPNDRKAPANTAVSLFDAAIPGTLPQLNKKCVEHAVKTALALNCSLNEVSMFDRKHYFYADSPAGYQITQQRKPIAVGGEISFLVSLNSKSPYEKKSKIRQIQLEQDSGKSLHFPETQTSLLDLNRAGVPLIEIVFEPDLSSGEEAAALLKELYYVLKALGTCSCEMSLGALRCDANVSIRKKGEPLGTRSEVKNVASITGVAKAIEYEIERQIKVVQSGGKVVNETRNWDADSKTTIAMRDKEVVQDYRFMPEPNLPPLHLSAIDVKGIKESLPELREQARKRLLQLGISIQNVDIITRHQNLKDLFDSCMREISDPKAAKTASNIILTCLLAACKELDIDIDDCFIRPESFHEVMKMQLENRATGSMIHRIFEEMLLNPSMSVQEIVEQHGLKQISDPEEIEKICRSAMEARPKFARRSREGKPKDFGKLMAWINVNTNGTIHTGLASQILRKLLDEGK